MLNRTFWMLLLGGWLVSACGVGSAAPSFGQCEGSLAGLPVSAPLFADESYFYRDDQHGGVEHAFVRMTAGTEVARGVRTLQVRAHLADMPERRHQGEHSLPAYGTLGSGYVDSWSMTIPTQPTLSGGTLTLVEASRSRLVGSAAMEFSDGSRVTCALELARNYRMDTDD